MKLSHAITPLIMSLALLGCNKAEKVENTDNSVPAQANAATVTASSDGAVATATVANATPEAHKKAREKIMKEWGKANKLMGSMIKDPTKFDAAEFKAAAAKLDQDVWVHFPADAKGGESKDTVWSDAAGFQAQIDKYKTAASALNAAAATATSADMVKTQQADVGASCKSGHEKFKKD